MDILDFAMKMEQDGMAFYKEHADKSTDPDLKKIFTTLVEEEARHYQIFKKLKEDPSLISDVDVTAPENLKTVQNIFEQMSHKTEPKTFGDDVVSVWTEALRIEEKARAFYRNKAETESDPERKKLLDTLAAEENRHVYMIDGVLMYLKDPQAFAQSAQFSNFMSLEGH